MDVAKDGMDLDATLEAVERRLLEKAMSLSGGVKARAAKLLNIKESALYYKLEKYGISPGSGPP